MENKLRTIPESAFRQFQALEAQMVELNQNHPRERYLPPEKQSFIYRRALKVLENQRKWVCLTHGLPPEVI